jgi:hypothetical protein
MFRLFAFYLSDPAGSLSLSWHVCFSPLRLLTYVSLITVLSHRRPDAPIEKTFCTNQAQAPCWTLHNALAEVLTNMHGTFCTV